MVRDTLTKSSLETAVPLLVAGGFGYCVYRFHIHPLWGLVVGPVFAFPFYAVMRRLFGDAQP